VHMWWYKFMLLEGNPQKSEKCPVYIKVLDKKHMTKSIMQMILQARNKIWLSITFKSKM